MSDKARRYLANKNRIELLPDRPLEMIAEVYTKGAHKHSIYEDEEGNKIPGKDIPFEDRGKYKIFENGDDNWRKGLSWKNTTGSLLRHIIAYRNGEDIDPELFTYHLANAGWNILTLLEYYHTHPELDDRPHKYLNHKRIGLDIDNVICDWTKAWGEKWGVPQRPAHWSFSYKNKERLTPSPELDEFYSKLPRQVEPVDLPFEPVAYLTARSVDEAVTKAWLEEHGFPCAPVYTVPFGKSKVDVAREAGIEWFIDDSFTNFVELNKAGICCFLYDAPHNQKYNVGYKRIKDFKDFKERFL